MAKRRKGMSSCTVIPLNARLLIMATIALQQGQRVWPIMNKKMPTIWEEVGLCYTHPPMHYQYMYCTLYIHVGQLLVRLAQSE